MIYTITFNPSLDYIVTVPEFKLGAVNRTEKNQNNSKTIKGREVL